MINLKNIKFAYNKPALIVTFLKKRYIILGDLHIGYEKRLIKQGIHIYNITDMMSREIINLSKIYKTKNIILLGDIKDSILHPEQIELESIKKFFNNLKDLNITIANGNHDAFLDNIINVKTQHELYLGEVALLHGNRFPSKEAMKRKVLVTAHNHIAVNIELGNNTFVKEKAWLIANINNEVATSFYKEIKTKNLIVLPAFNPMIIGKSVNSNLKNKNINPLFNNNIFDYNNSQVYDLSGKLLGNIKFMEENLKE